MIYAHGDDSDEVGADLLITHNLTQTASFIYLFHSCMSGLSFSSSYPPSSDARSLCSSHC